MLSSSSTVAAMTRPTASRRLAMREFVRALASPHTYNVRRNIYALVGFLFGLLIPIASLTAEISAAGRPYTWAEIPEAFARYPLHWLFLLQPFVFGVVFGAMGAVRLQKNLQIVRLIDVLEAKVAALAEANEQLKDLDRMKSEFLANVSHDLKTPLVSISGYTEMIVQGRLGETTSEQREALAVMNRNLEHLIHLIDGLLDVARLEAGRARIAREPFDLAETVRTAIASMRPVFRERDLGIVLEGVEIALRVLGDRETVFRVLVNLLSNAGKFTPRGGRVGVRLTPGPDAVEVEIWDEGTGFDETDLAHLFERFWRRESHGGRQTRGSGLGLAIVKEILERHGSRIEASNRQGGGARIRFRLPRDGAHPAAAPPAPPHEPPAGTGR
jgi:signal transduction histidine kinase